MHKALLCEHCVCLWAFCFWCHNQDIHIVLRHLTRGLMDNALLFIFVSENQKYRLKLSTFSEIRWGSRCTHSIALCGKVKLMLCTVSCPLNDEWSFTTQTNLFIILSCTVIKAKSIYSSTSCETLLHHPFAHNYHVLLKWISQQIIYFIQHWIY